MSPFLNHLAARARGAVLRLEPRRPAPYEAIPITADPSPMDGLRADPAPHAPLSGATAMAPQALDTVAPTLTAPPSMARAPDLPSRAAGPSTPEDAGPTGAMSEASRDRTEIATASGSSSPFSPTLPAEATLHTALPRPAAIPPPPPDRIHPAVLSQPPSSPHELGRATPTPEAPQPLGPIAAALTPMGFTPWGMAPPPASRPSASQAASSWPNQTTAPRGPGDRAAPVIPTPLHPLASVRPDRVEPSASERGAPPQPQRAPVEVHIGTIEILAEPIPAPPPTRAAATPRGLSLDEFLNGTGRR